MIGILRAMVTVATAIISMGASSSGAIQPGNVDNLLVDRSITVEAGDTLTIEPGTVVSLAGHASIVVRGTLLAVGTEHDSIRFEPSTDRPWSGLHVVDGGTARIAFAVLTSATARVQDRPIGGAISADGPNSLIEISDSRLSGNESSEAGGALALERGARARVVRTVFHSNRSGAGGAVAVGPGTADFRQVVFRGNSAENAGGGVVVADGGVATFRECTFFGNETGQAGGGLVVAREGQADLSDCRFWANESRKVGGAVGVAERGTLRANHVTIAGNHASYPLGGGAIAVSDGAVEIANSIVWRNTRSEISNNPFASGTVAVMQSIVRGGYDGEGNLDADPKFSDLANGDLSLLPDSPAWRRSEVSTANESPGVGARLPHP